MLSPSFMLLNAFIRLLSYLLQLKIILIPFCICFFSQFLENFIFSWRFYHLVVFIGKLRDNKRILVMAFVLLKLCKFRYLSFLKSSFVCEKKVIFFIFTTIPSFLWKNIILFFIFLLIYSIIQHLEYIRDQIRHIVRVLQVSHFCHPPQFFLS